MIRAPLWKVLHTLGDCGESKCRANMFAIRHTAVRPAADDFASRRPHK
jgi:hypothetical protein